MSDLWFYGQDGTQRGPVEFAALKALAAAGSLRRTDLVWREGMADWVAAESIADLSSSPIAAPIIAPTLPPVDAPVISPPAAPPLDAVAAPPIAPANPQPMAYAPGPLNPNEQNGRAVTSLVLGILSLVTCGCPFVGLALGVTAIILGVGVQPGPNKGLAVGGFVCGIIGGIFSLLGTANFFFHL